MDETLIAACQMFLVPATILFAAIAIANTEPLKFLISAIGTVLAGVWYGRLTVWDLSHADKITAKWLAGTFFVAALVSTVVHFFNWCKPHWWPPHWWPQQAQQAQQQPQPHH